MGVGVNPLLKSSSLPQIKDCVMVYFSRLIPVESLSLSAFLHHNYLLLSFLPKSIHINLQASFKNWYTTFTLVNIAECAAHKFEFSTHLKLHFDMVKMVSSFLS